MAKSNKLIEMQTFVTVVDMGSFAAAANRLDLSKQTVSQHMSNLEQRLQARLIQRTTRKMSLTGEGQNFYLQSKAILAAIDEAELSIHPVKAEPVGTIRVNVPVSFGRLYLAPLWQNFMDKYPKVDLYITLSDRAVDLLEEGDDVAVVVGQVGSSSFISRHLASTRLVLCATPAYLKQHGTPTKLKDLHQHRIIAYKHWSRKENWQFVHQAQEISIAISPSVFCNNGDTCRMMLLQNGGISLQPDFIVGQDIQKGHLVEVLPNYRCADLDIQAIYPTRKQLPLRIRCLVDFLVQELKAEPWRIQIQNL